MNCGENGRFHPISSLNLNNYGQNGHYHPTPWLNLMNVGRTAVPTQHCLHQFLENGQQGVARSEDLPQQPNEDRAPAGGWAKLPKKEVIDEATIRKVVADMDRN